MPLPFRLEEGIYFEDSQLLLPWGAPLEFLELVDNPLVTSDQLRWPAKQCFGGHRLPVEVLRNQYFNTQGILEVVFFERNSADPWGVFTTYSALFSQALGPPSQVQDDGYGRPIHTWLFGKVAISVGVGERFDDFVIFNIRKEK